MQLEFRIFHNNAKFSILKFSSGYTLRSEIEARLYLEKFCRELTFCR
jgi:hypothetical protein